MSLARTVLCTRTPRFALAEHKKGPLGRMGRTDSRKFVRCSILLLVGRRARRVSGGYSARARAARIASDGPREAREGRAHFTTVESQEPVQRPWWRRVFAR